MTESQLNSIKTVGILFVNHSLIALMSPSQRKKCPIPKTKLTITLIEKQGKDRTLIENWGPISLVNVDAKIISKVIDSRIKNVSPYIIHSNQTGYVKDRYMGPILVTQQDRFLTS